MQNMSGRKLGQYELRERLGRGGMAEVYKAYQPSMDRFIAIKVMLGHIAGEAEFVERFRREAHAVGKLRHPHIVQIFDFGVEDEVYYMAMEFIRGGNLKEHIDTTQKLPLRDALQIASQVTDALVYAHAAGMIYRDLKPANVMFADDAHQHAILTDFGIARILGQTGLTGTGVSVGTPDYISPEIGQGEESDHRADIYAMGIMLYEMLTGNVPYSADTPLAVVLKHIQAPLPTRADYGDDVPEALEKVILRCLAKNPDDRFETAQALKDALDQARRTLDQKAATQKTEQPAEPATQVSQNVETRPGMVQTPDEKTPDEKTPDEKTPDEKTPDEKTLETEHNQTEKMPEPAAEAPTRNNMTLIAAIVALVVLFGAGLFALSEGEGTGGDDDETIVAAVTDVTDEAEIVPPPTDEPAPATDVPDLTEEAPPSDGTEDNDDGMRAPARLDYRGERPPHPDNLRLSSGYSQQIDIAERLILLGEFEEIRETLDAALEENPDDVQALFARSQLHIALFEREAAIEDAQKLITLAPDNALAYIALYDAQENFDMRDLAADTIEKAYALDPENPQVMWRYGQSFAEWDEQIEFLTVAENAKASGARFMVYAGWTYFDKGAYTRAIPYMEVIDKSDTIISGYENRANLMGALMLTDQMDAALELAQETAIGEVNARILGELAYVAYSAGDFEQAEQWANRATTLSGEAYEAIWVKALIDWYGDGDLSAAIEALDGLRDPLFTGAFYPRYLTRRYDHHLLLDIARIFADATRYDDALAVYDEYLENEPWIPAVYEERAFVHAELGDVEFARDDLVRAIEIARDLGDVDYVEDLVRQIDELGSIEPVEPDEPDERGENDETDQAD